MVSKNEMLIVSLDKNQLIKNCYIKFVMKFKKKNYEKVHKPKKKKKQQQI